AQYRSTLEFHDGALAEAEAALGRIEGFLDRAARADQLTETTTAASRAMLPAAFIDAMDDDLNIPRALAVLHDAVRVGNAALDGGDLATARERAVAVLDMTRVLGIDPTDPSWSSGTDPVTHRSLSALVERLLVDRADARVAKDFAAADRIRDELTAAGITIEDTPAGAHWSISGK
ncbi:DALR domain-containing protein, partial [Xanthomonas citri]|uniref:DALR domain-containing protein n=1 Tax=Xanthomonas citri TaxID=346 RepID=UPI003F7D73CF